VLRAFHAAGRPESAQSRVAHLGGERYGSSDPEMNIVGVRDRRELCAEFLLDALPALRSWPAAAHG
jgi:hypothetical protein